MKANKKFVEENEEAVSAVIGVILMVAITVAIAATVYVYVSGMLGTGAEKAPDMSFTKASTGNLGLTITRADAGLTWGEFEIREQVGNGTADVIYVYGNATDVQAGQFVPVTIQPITADTVITIRHLGTNTLMGTWTWYL